MRRRTAVQVASGAAAAAIVMATASAGWGDAPDQGVVVPVPATTLVPATTIAGLPVGAVTIGPFVLGGYAEAAQLTITNTDGPAGQTYTDCKPLTMLDKSCKRSVTVTGTNITNTIEPKAVPDVELWWLDEPFAAAALRQPDGLVEDTLGDLCKTQGVPLPTSGPVAVIGGSFTKNVLAPPADDTSPTIEKPIVPRPVFYYGVNAVCATWTHTVDGLPHTSATIGTYTIRPTPSP